MAIDVRRIVLQAALRTLQLEGTNQADLQTSYDLTLTALDGADVPLKAFKDAVIAVEGELTEIIANDRTHPYRSLFYGRSDDLLPGARMPTEDDELTRFVGTFGSIKDSVDGIPLSETTLPEMRRYLRGGYQGEVYKYTIVGETLLHTRVTAFLEGCVFSSTVARQRFDPPYRLSPIPDALEATWVARTIQFLPQENWLGNEAAMYGRLAEQGINNLRNRNLVLPELPAVEVTPNPRTN